MKVYISADMEGVTGVTSWSETLREGGIGYDRACIQMGREVAAACRGALRAGAEEVVAKDSHDTGLNIPPDALPRKCRLLRGWCRNADSMMAYCDQGFDMAFMVGYHSEAYDDGNPLAHTSSNSRLLRVTVNGRRAAEMDINAYIAAGYGLPVALLTGDRGLCEKARVVLPGVRTVAVKEGIGAGTLNMNVDEACDLIEQRAFEAVKGFPEGNCRCLEIPEKFVLQIEYKDHMLAKGASLYPGTVRVDEHTVRIECSSVEELKTAYSFMA